MHFRKLVFSVLAVFAIGQMASAQVQRCITPEIKDGEAFENWLLDVRSANTIQRLAATTYNIPVIVHIIHDGEAVGQGDNISLDQVISQFVVLNADFTRTNADSSETPTEFLPVAAGMDISFVPAIVNEAGDTLAEPGVHRVNRNGQFDPPPYNSSYINGTIKPATIWNPDEYFNIWVMDFSEALGYAQPPVAALPDLDPTADANLDGIVVRSSAFGTLGSVSAPWDKGRVTTHEAGHWLGLYHLWGQSNDNACGEDDYVADTPNQDEPNQFCPSTQGPVCSGVTREMWENYMDYTWDQCMNLFTMGQVDRMTTVVENAPRRNTLLVSDVGGKFNQQINFSTLAESTYGDEVFTLTAFSSSGLPLLYSSSDESVATVTGSNVTIIGAGSTVITASQEGNFLFNPASFVQQTLVVNKADQTITFEPIPTLTYNDPSIELIASSSSTLEVTFSSPETIVSIAGTMLNILGAGEATITASQAGNDNYNATSVFQVIDILKAEQTITFGPIEPVVYGGPDFALDATSSSNLAVEYLSVENSVAMVLDGIVETGNAGETTIKAFQQGDENYLAADTVEQLLIVNKADQVVTLDSIPNQIYGDQDFILRAVADSNLPVMALESSDSMIIDITDSIAVITGVGEAVIRAVQPGDENHNPALDSQIVFVDKGFQNWVISGLQDYQDTIGTIPLSIATSSGLSPEFVVDGPIHQEDSIWVIDTAGLVSIFANQAGNEFYNPADTTINLCLIPSPVINEILNPDSTILISPYQGGNEWSFGGSIISFEQKIKAELKGSYDLKVTAGECTGMTSTLVKIVGLQDLVSGLKVNVYPNPSKYYLALDFIGEIPKSTYLSISDISGRQIKTLRKINSNTQKIDINHLFPGVYFLQLIVDERPFTIRFVKE